MPKLRITKKFIHRVIYVTIASVVANVVVLVVAKNIFVVPNTFSPFFYSSVIEFTIAGVIGAGAVYVCMGMIFKKRNRNKDFVLISVAVLILSFIPDLLMPFSSDADNQGATWAIVFVLMLQHVIPAILVIFGFTKGVEDTSEVVNP